MSETVDAILDHTQKGVDPLGQHREIAVDLRGYQYVLQGKRPTYFSEIGVVAGAAGFAAELIPAAGMKVIVHNVFFTKPSVTVTYRLIKNSSASTGGTSTNSPVTPLDSGDPASGTTVKLFTAIPTAGTAVGDVFEMVMNTTDSVLRSFGENGAAPLVLRGNTQTLAVNVSAAATIVGYIEFSEEAL